MTGFLQLLGGFIALAGFAAGLSQYAEAQRWKRSEFAAKQLERLTNDPMLLTCCKVLDWRARTFRLPETLRIRSDEESFTHSWDVLGQGIQPEDVRGKFDRTMEIYRDLFDAFFAYLEEINHYIDIDLIGAEQVASIEYWLQQIARPRFGGQVKFGPFLKAYGYGGVRELMKKFNVQYDAD